MNNDPVLNRMQTAEQANVNDRTRCFGYTGGVPHLKMDAKKSGLDCNPIIGGKLLLFLPTKGSYLGGLDVQKGVFPRIHYETMPSAHATVVNRMFHSQEDFGYRNLPMLTKLRYDVTSEGYRDDADDYFAIVHPFIANCPYGLNQAVQMEDPEIGDSQSVWQFCPTCQLMELQSEACEQRIYQASSVMDSAILADLRATVIEACEASVRHVSRKSQMIFSDMAKKMTGAQPGRNVLNTIDRVHLQMLHKTEPKGSDNMAEIMGAFVSALKEAGMGPQSQPVQPQGVVLTGEEFAAYEKFKATQNTPIAETGEWSVGMAVLCDGERGEIAETKTGGWFEVKLEGGETKTVRKDRLTHAEG